MNEETISKLTESDKAVLFLSGYSTHKKDKISIEAWLELSEEIKTSPSFKNLMTRTL